MLFRSEKMEAIALKEVLVLKNKQGEKEPIKLDYSILRKSVLILRAVNHKLRQKMIKLLEEEGRMTVTEIYVKMRLEQSVASQHLALLRRSGVVVTERDGKFIFYSLDKNRIGEISQLLEDLVN